MLKLAAKSGMRDMAAPEYGPNEFNVGSAVAQCFRIILQRPVQVLLIAALLIGIPAAAQEGGFIWIGTLPLEPMEQFGAIQALSQLSAALFALGYMALVPVVTNGLGLGQVESGLQTFVRLAIPAILSQLLYVVAVLIGTVLLIVPGIIASLAFYVVLPCLVIEKTGVIGAFRRSADLTRGRRGRLFGFVLAITMISLVPYLLAYSLISGLTTNGPWANYLIMTLRGGVWGLIGIPTAVAPTVVYWQLIRAKAATEGSQVAQVFS
jgi:hypothetical protein